MQKIRDMKNQVQQDLHGQPTDVKHYPEHLTQSQADQQNQQIHALESRVHELMVENDNLKKNVGASSCDTESLKCENEHLKKDLDNLNDVSTSKITHLDHQLKVLIQEIEKIQQVIIAKDNQLQDSYKRNHVLQDENSLLQSQASQKNNDHEVHILKDKQQQMVLLHEEEVNGLKNQLKSKDDEILHLSKVSHDNNNKSFEQSERNIILLTQEIERLTFAMKKKDEELSQANFKNTQNHSELDRVNSILRTQSEEMEQYKLLVRNLQTQKDVNSVSNSELSNLKYQVDEWKSKHDNLDKQVHQKNSEIKSLIDENEKLRHQPVHQPVDTKQVEDLKKSEADLRDRLALSYSLIDDLKKQILDANLKNQHNPQQPSSNLSQQEPPISSSRRVISTRVIQQEPSTHIVGEPKVVSTVVKEEKPETVVHTHESVHAHPTEKRVVHETVKHSAHHPKTHTTSYQPSSSYTTHTHAAPVQQHGNISYGNNNSYKIGQQ